MIPRFERYLAGPTDAVLDVGVEVAFELLDFGRLEGNAEVPRYLGEEFNDFLEAFSNGFFAAGFCGFCGFCGFYSIRRFGASQHIL